MTNLQQFEIKCSRCGDGWCVSDRERTEEEKKNWVCGVCIKAERETETKIRKSYENALYGKI